jgi:RNA polymerase sigma-70 factor (ECF subfamily)
VVHLNRLGRRDEPRRVDAAAHLTDDALVGLVARGDEQALAALYDRHARLAYGVARRLLRDAQLAEDAVQEGFLNVWRQAASFRPDRSRAASWILMLVHRRAVDLVRREERRRTDVLDDDERAIGVAEDSAMSKLEGEWARKLLTELPDQQREVLELAFWGGYTQSELADRLGVPLGTVKSRMFNGMARLRQLMEDETWTTASIGN